MSNDATNTFNAMRRKSRELSKDQSWQALLSSHIHYGVLGTVGLPEEGNYPYVVPMNYVADSSTNSIYLHSTKDPNSKRARAIARNSKVSFAIIDPRSELDPDENGQPCMFSMKYLSIMIIGKIKLVESNRDKLLIMNKFMEDLSGDSKYRPIPEDALKSVEVLRIKIKHISGKYRKFEI